VIVTGDELVTPGTALRPHQIYEANSYLLCGLIDRDGGVLDSTVHVGDDQNRVQAAMTRPGADLIIVSGGSSVGTEDHAPLIMAKSGELAIHGIAMRPSSPTGIGRLGDAVVFLLPGNPVSSLCAYDFFAGRAIRLRGGRPSSWPYRQTRETVGRKIVSSVGRVDYCRIRKSPDGIEPLAISGASMLSSTTRADGFVVVSAESEGIGPGESALVHWYDS
jgi:molybdopterin molybdotransferase